MSAIRKLIDAYADALENHIYDAGNGEAIPPEEFQLLADAESELNVLESK